MTQLIGILSSYLQISGNVPYMIAVSNKAVILHENGTLVSEITCSHWRNPEELKEKLSLGRFEREKHSFNFPVALQIFLGRQKYQLSACQQLRSETPRYQKAIRVEQ